MNALDLSHAPELDTEGARGDVSSPSVTLLREIFTYLSIWRAIQYFLSNTGLGGRAHYAELKRLLWRFSPRLVTVNLPCQIPKFQRLSASRETMSTDCFLSWVSFSLYTQVYPYTWGKVLT